MKVRNADNYNLVDTQTAVRKEIKSTRERSQMVWDKVEGRVYVTCRSCDAINDVTDHTKALTVHYDGLVKGPCFVCTNCQAHYYFRLEGWGFESGPTIVYCYGCGGRSRIVDKGDIRNLRRGGWTISKKPGETFCKECRRRRKR